MGYTMAKLKNDKLKNDKLKEIYNNLDNFYIYANDDEKETITEMQTKLIELDEYIQYLQGENYMYNYD